MRALLMLLLILLGLMLYPILTPRQDACRCGHICDGAAKCGLTSCPRGHR